MGTGRQAKEYGPIVLAGGLTAANVAQAWSQASGGGRGQRRGGRAGEKGPGEAEGLF